MGPEIVTLGEPLLEFNASHPGSLRDVETYEVGWGGDTSNFAIAASRLGGSAGYICRLGDDDFGQILLDLWHREGVDTRFVIRDEHAQTGIYFVSRQSETHSFTYYRSGSAASRIAPADVPSEYIAGAKIFHASGISQGISNSACDAVFYAIDIARDAGVLVSYDPNIRLKLWSKGRACAIVNETIGLADFVLLSIEDASILTGKSEPEEIAAKLLEKGPRVVAVKMGGDGALISTSGTCIRIPPFIVNVLDATGAGDTFDAAFVTAYLRGCSLEECGKFANAAAALSTTGLGAVKGIPRKHEVDALLKKLLLIKNQGRVHLCRY